MNIEVKEREDVVAFAVYGSDNVWVDHCTFHNSLTMEYDEVGKFIWVNTSVYVNKNPDFVTLSYNVFSHRFWGVAFGTTTGVDEDRASVMYNYFDSIVHRAPQLGNGTLHVYNNYYERNDGSIYNDGFAAIKCGAGSVVYSDANCFESYKKESSGYWDNEVTVDSQATFKDVGSYTNKSENGGGSFYALTAPSCTVTTWNPASNYGYEIITVYGSNDVRAFCKAYAGEVTSQSELKYITDASCSPYVSKKVSSPFLQSNVDTSSTGNTESDALDGKIIMFKNANSNLYLEVTGGTASNGTNVQQWGAYGAASHNSWKLVSADDGYCYIYSQVGGGSTYLLDVANNSASSGTNIQIWQNTYCNAQLFKIAENTDGTYTIYTKASNGESCVEVQDGSSSSGGNIQQWGYAGGSWQKWYIEIVS